MLKPTVVGSSSDVICAMIDMYHNIMCACIIIGKELNALIKKQSGQVESDKEDDEIDAEKVSDNGKCRCICQLCVMFGMMCVVAVCLLCHCYSSFTLTTVDYFMLDSVFINTCMYSVWFVGTGLVFWVVCHTL